MGRCLAAGALAVSFGVAPRGGPLAARSEVGAAAVASHVGSAVSAVSAVAVGGWASGVLDGAVVAAS